MENYSRKVYLDFLQKRESLRQQGIQDSTHDKGPSPLTLHRAMPRRLTPSEERKQEMEEPLLSPKKKKKRVVVKKKVKVKKRESSTSQSKSPLPRE